jgi:hypothetical protein
MIMMQYFGLSVGWERSTGRTVVYEWMSMEEGAEPRECSPQLRGPSMPQPNKIHRQLAKVQALAPHSVLWLLPGRYP